DSGPGFEARELGEEGGAGSGMASAPPSGPRRPYHRGVGTEWPRRRLCLAVGAWTLQKARRSRLPPSPRQKPGS
ncbi:Hypothetical predicted protein, partial [Marmota monax]